jgi:DnaJ-class molecular chaperone
MGGLLKPRWQRRADDLSRDHTLLLERIADLEAQISSLTGRMRACENQALAANNRAERLETRFSKLEAQITMPNAFERRLPPGEEDNEHLVKWAICSTCRGSGIVAWLSGEPAQAIPCTSCNGMGRIEIVS